MAIDIAPALDVAPGGNPLVVAAATDQTVLTPYIWRLRLDVGATFDVF